MVKSTERRTGKTLGFEVFPARSSGSGRGRSGLGVKQSLTRLAIDRTGLGELDSDSVPFPDQFPSRRSGLETGPGSENRFNRIGSISGPPPVAANSLLRAFMVRNHSSDSMSFLWSGLHASRNPTLSSKCPGVC